MSRRQSKQSSRITRPKRKRAGDVRTAHLKAGKLAEQGHAEQAEKLLCQLKSRVRESRLRALISNDLAALAFLKGDGVAAQAGFESALTIDGNCEPARLNLAFLQAEAAVEPPSAPAAASPLARRAEPESPQGVKVAILSFLFNWPSTGGGIIHTVELAKFLAKAGFEVRHFYAEHRPWGVGAVDAPLPIKCHAIRFDASTWNLPTIQKRFRDAVDGFGPDYVIITDSWNMKPRLAQAMRGYRTLLRFQAQECLCPLNNLRLLADSPGCFTQCPRHQLATPNECGRCLGERGHRSGTLHQAEREVAGVGTSEYLAVLKQSLHDAEAVLVLNPLVEAMLSPYARRVAVVPWGMDAARFPWPPSHEPRAHDRKLTIFQAGLVDEAIKGFDVLHAACGELWSRRQDFELVATGEPAGRRDSFTRFVGWAAQEDLPRHYRATDIVVVPTIAQEGLSRTSVEAMASGRPVVASRIGGLPYTVLEGTTGLLCEPGNASDLAEKLTVLLDDPPLRERMGLAGRRRYEEHYTWNVVIERHYRPLLQPVRS